MLTEAPLLTIAIPTYNRSKFLAQLLDSLASQLEEKEAVGRGVELLISDNASIDGTDALLEEYRLRGLNFRSIRNATNIGPDANFAQCFEEAVGQYVWIVGDDDIVLPGGIAVILNLLHEGNFDIIHLRARPFIEGDGARIGPHSPRIEITNDARTFTSRTHVYLTFISGNIINKRRVLCRQHQPFSALIGTNLVQLGWTYTALRSFEKGACILDPIIAAGVNDRGGYQLVAIFGTNLKRITETWLVEPELVRIVLNGTLQTFFPHYILGIKRGRETFAEEKYANLLHELFSHNWRYYLFLYPILKLPGAVGRIWLLLCRIVNRVDRAMGNPMLR